MTDKDKVALLCILIIVAVVIWSKPGKNDFSSKTADIFHELEEVERDELIKIPDNRKMAELWETVNGEFGRSPFLEKDS